MVCRTEPIGSALTSWVIQSTSLEERQVLSLYHETLRTHRDAAAPTAQAQEAALNALAASVTGSDLSHARRNSIMRRINEARRTPLSGARFNTIRGLANRAQLAERALDGHVTQLARTLGTTQDDITTRLRAHRDEALADRTLRAPAEFISALRDDPATVALPLDRQTTYALHQLRTQADAAHAAAPSVPTVRRERMNSSSVAEMGHDPVSGRVEVVMRSNPGVVYAYRMTAEEYAAFRNAPSVGSFFATNVRRNNDYRYATQDEQNADSVRTQCGTCGQFAGPVHACPVRDSAEERAATEHAARRRTRLVPGPLLRDDAQAAATSNPPTPAATPARPAAAPADTPPVPAEGSTRSYLNIGGYTHAPNITSLRQSARRHPGGVTANVYGAVGLIAGPDGASQPVTPTSTQFPVRVLYNGRGQGYTVTPYDAPTETPAARQRRCSCPEYARNYDCVHIRQTLQNLHTLLNQDRLRGAHGLGPALEAVNTELAADHDASVASQAVAAGTWPESPVSYTDDHAAFQRDYKAAKDRAAAGEQAIPYMTENATGGLLAPGTGRAAGVELEFDIDPEYLAANNLTQAQALANIGQALHRAGYTRTARQEGYHAGQRRGYTENHRGGWSFEQDCTVAGEIVSPGLRDTPETWRNLAAVCDIIRDNGGIATARGGSHVHVGVGDYNHTVANHNRLLGLYAEHEDLIYRLSANPERGTHRGVRWCSPNTVPASGYTSVGSAHNANVRRAINLGSVTGQSSDHVEFRTFDSSLDPAVIQAQIKLAAGLSAAAHRETSYQPARPAPLGARRAHNREAFGASRRLTGDDWKADTSSYRKLADLIFHRPEDKAQLTALFATTRWQRRS